MADQHVQALAAGEHGHQVGDRGHAGTVPRPVAAVAHQAPGSAQVHRDKKKGHQMVAGRVDTECGHLHISLPVSKAPRYRTKIPAVHHEHRGARKRTNQRTAVYPGQQRRE
ncbi:hypothetical protein D3C85_1391550 [compost metagenome]